MEQNILSNHEEEPENSPDEFVLSSQSEEERIVVQCDGSNLQKQDED